MFLWFFFFFCTCSYLFLDKTCPKKDYNERKEYNLDYQIKSLQRKCMTKCVCRSYGVKIEGELSKEGRNKIEAEM